jgi:cellulose synthase/poly-beta-1,6-N-acetylglucosamine synthase-like glycosyltransferase
LIILELIFWVCGVLLFWTYFGYPAFMYLWAKFLPHKVQKVEGHLPSATLLICAYNEQDVIGNKLENTIRIDYPNLEVLVVNDGSDDNTREIVEKYTDKGITLINQPQRSGKMTAVNTGFALAKGDIVILSDASPDYAPDALRHLLASFADGSVGVVVGTLAIWDRATSVAKPAGLYWKYEAALRRWESQTGSTVAVHGNMFAMRRSLFRPLTGATVNDEFSLAMETLKQGYRVVYEPKAMSYDDASDSMRDEFKRRARINAGRWQALFSAGYLMSAPTWDLRFRLFSHKLLRPLTPLLMIAFAVATVILVAFANTALYTAALIAQIVFYGLAAAGWYAERQGRRIKILNIPYYFVSSNFAALVGLWRWLRGAQKVTWQKREAK